MIHHVLTITLLSDAEPGTGKGTEVLDGLLPRNQQNQPILPAAHLKGLLRDRLWMLCELRNWPETLVNAILGQSGTAGHDGRLGLLRLTDAAPADDKSAPVMHIARTAVGEYGTAHDGSLRTVEAVAAGTVFKAEVWIDAEADSIFDQVVRLGLMSIEAVGGGRTRGAGLCRIEIECESRTPGELLKNADSRISAHISALGNEAFKHKAPEIADNCQPLNPGPACWYRLIFRATAPVCCPEIPINGATNHVRSGPAIPASAVQGALLTRISSVNNALATACFNDPRFRAWPLLPVLPGDEPDNAPVPHAVRVDLTHRMSKHPDGKQNNAKENSCLVKDNAIEPYHWSDTPDGSPLKSSDGILRRDANGTINLWKTGDLPRYISSHSVHWSEDMAGRRNLFSVEALAPMVFTGLVAMPEEAGNVLENALKTDCNVAFGKARGIRGSGRLEFEQVKNIADVISANTPAECPGRVFVVQSPLALPDDFKFGTAESACAIKYLAEKAGWGKVVLTSEHKGSTVSRTAVTCGVRFGWNRHDLGAKKADPKHKRLRACRVILPGSVLVLEKPLDDLPGKLLAGLGEGREQGFGALLPHPGMASAEPYRPEPKRKHLKSQDTAGVKALEFFLAAGKENGPSPSQIAAVSRRLDQGDQAIKYLEQQERRGSTRHWQRWENVFDELKDLVAKDPKFTGRVLRAWQDLAIIHRPDKEN